MINQNVIVTSGAQDPVNRLAELSVLRVQSVICLRFRARHSHLAIPQIISVNPFVSSRLHHSTTNVLNTIR